MGEWKMLHVPGAARESEIDKLRPIRITVANRSGKMSELMSIYEGYWKCRDLEIQMLWTRLTLLGTFMALTYTGYGYLIIKVTAGIAQWSAFNLLAVAAGLIGVIFSVMWIATAKGSKGWFERYEAMIKRIQEERGKELLNDEEPKKGGTAEGDKSILSYLGYNAAELEPYLDPVDSSLFTQCAGRFSVSKIPIVMGQVSLFGWSMVIAGHAWCLFVGKTYTRMVVEALGVKIAFVGIVATCLATIAICRRARSSSL